MVDVVIVAYNSCDRLRDCVRPFLGIDWIQPIVVDNASPDRSADTVSDLPVTIVHEVENRGFGAGCNAGWRRGTASFVLFLNPDAALPPLALRRLVDAMELDPGVGGMGPRIVDERGLLDFSIRRFPRLRSTYAQALFLHRLLPRASWTDEVVRDESRYAKAGMVEWLSGACLLVRREVLERIGGFDEAFFMYCEDTDLCRRIGGLGLTVRFEPSATAVHAGGASAPRVSLLPILADSRVRYALRHRRATAALAERIGVALSSLTHAAVSSGGSAARREHLLAAARALRPMRT